LNKKDDKSENRFINWSNGLVFEVTNNLFIEKFIVNLELKTCNYYLWDLCGIFCWHDVSII